MEKNNTASKKIRRLFIFVIPFLLAPGLNGCFLDDVTKMMDAFKPYMKTLTEKAAKPENQQLFQQAADQGEKKWQDGTRKELGESAASTGAPKVETLN